MNQLFEGAVADLAIYKAKNIATIFQYKLGLKQPHQNGCALYCA
ncbi:MAG: hypothetical protein ABI315_01250 [Bacteroidia bacterium]